jgi:type VI secretion system secreted protein Hcp
MSTDAFLKLGDLKGESVVKGFEDQIQVLSWNWGMSQAGTTHRGTGGGAGKVDVQDMSISKTADTASPNLAMACCTGKHFPEATLTVRKAGETPLDFLVITMTDVIITSVSEGGAYGAEEVDEQVSLNFAKFKYSYQPQDNKGAKAGGAVEIEYDIAKNA